MKPTIKLTTYFNPVIANDKGFEQALITQLSKIVAETKSLMSGHVSPKNGGNLRASQMWRTSEAQGGFDSGKGEKEITARPQKMTGYAGANVDYFIYEEYGTRYRPAHPNFRAAIAITQGESKDIVIRKLNESMAAANFKGSAKVKWF